MGTSRSVLLPLAIKSVPSNRKRAAKSFAGRGCGITSAGLGTGRHKNCATTQERGIKVLQGTQLWGQGLGLSFGRLRYEARRVSPVQLCMNIDGAAACIAFLAVSFVEPFRDSLSQNDDGRAVFVRNESSEPRTVLHACRWRGDLYHTPGNDFRRTF